MRWILLLEPLGYKPSVIKTFYAVCIGYFANIAFPRLGEISRCTVLQQAEKISFETGIGSVISERIIDFLSLCGLSVVVFITQYGLMHSFFIQYILPNIPSLSQKMIMIISGLMLLFLGIVYYLFKKWKGLYAKALRIAKEISKGFISVLHLKKKGAFLFHTIFIWAMYFLMTYICVFTIPATYHLTPNDGLFLLIAGSLGMMLPVQGGIGVFHYFISGAITLFGISQQDGLVYATIVHSSQMLFTIFLGCFSLIMLAVSRKKAYT
jgi:uncharacterized membrane protein YbhN (UPF0104 family)